MWQTCDCSVSSYCLQWELILISVYISKISHKLLQSSAYTTLLLYYTIRWLSGEVCSCLVSMLFLSFPFADDSVTSPCVDDVLPQLSTSAAFCSCEFCALQSTGAASTCVHRLYLYNWLFHQIHTYQFHYFIISLILTPLVIFSLKCADSLARYVYVSIVCHSVLTATVQAIYLVTQRADSGSHWGHVCSPVGLQ